VSVERWCRLRGNLLFYFKSRDQLSEPAGLIVMEDVDAVEVEEDVHESTFGLVIVFKGGELKRDFFVYSYTTFLD